MPETLSLIYIRPDARDYMTRDRLFKRSLLIQEKIRIWFTVQTRGKLTSSLVWIPGDTVIRPTAPYRHADFYAASTCLPPPLCRLGWPAQARLRRAQVLPPPAPLSGALGPGRHSSPRPREQPGCPRPRPPPLRPHHRGLLSRPHHLPGCPCFLPHLNHLFPPLHPAAAHLCGRPRPSESALRREEKGTSSE